MKLKPAILSVLDRDDLKHIVDDLEIDGVDRRSVEDMRVALSRARRAKAEDLLWYLQKGQIKEVCELVGVPDKGKRDELVERLVTGEAPPERGRSFGRFTDCLNTATCRRSARFSTAAAARPMRNALRKRKMDWTMPMVSCSRRCEMGNPTGMHQDEQTVGRAVSSRSPRNPPLRIFPGLKHPLS